MSHNFTCLYSLVGNRTCVMTCLAQCALLVPLRRHFGTKAKRRGNLVPLIESSWDGLKPGSPWLRLAWILRPCTSLRWAYPVLRFSMTSLSYPSAEVIDMWAENGNALKLLFDYVGIAQESSHNIIPMLGFHGDEPMDRRASSRSFMLVTT